MGAGLHAITYVSTTTTTLSDAGLVALLTPGRAADLARDLTSTRTTRRSPHAPCGI